MEITTSRQIKQVQVGLHRSARFQTYATVLSQQPARELNLESAKRATADTVVHLNERTGYIIIRQHKHQ